MNSRQDSLVLNVDGTVVIKTSKHGTKCIWTSSLFLFLFFLFFAHTAWHGILHSRLEIEPMLLSVEVQSLNYRTVREVPQAAFLGKRYPRHKEVVSFQQWNLCYFVSKFSSVQYLSPVRTLCDPMNCKTPGLSVHHQLPEFTQIHVPQVGDAIQPFHLLLSPSPPAPNPSQHQSLFKWVNSSYEVAKVLEFHL